MSIKKNINLQHLKRSAIPKHRKIYEKAIKMMAEGYSTPELTHTEIEIIAERFNEHGIRINVSINGDISIRSKCDNWTVVDEGRYYALYHETTVGSRGKNRYSYHLQDIFYDLDFLFASIVSHDEYKIGADKPPSIEQVQELVKELSVLCSAGEISVMEYVY